MCFFMWSLNCALRPRASCQHLIGIIEVRVHQQFTNEIVFTDRIFSHRIRCETVNSTDRSAPLAHASQRKSLNWWDPSAVTTRRPSITSGVCNPLLGIGRSIHIKSAGHGGREMLDRSRVVPRLELGNSEPIERIRVERLFCGAFLQELNSITKVPPLAARSGPGCEKRARRSGEGFARAPLVHALCPVPPGSRCKAARGCAGRVRIRDSVVGSRCSRGWRCSRLRGASVKQRVRRGRADNPAGVATRPAPAARATASAPDLLRRQ